MSLLGGWAGYFALLNSVLVGALCVLIALGAQATAGDASHYVWAARLLAWPIPVCSLFAYLGALDHPRVWGAWTVWFGIAVAALIAYVGDGTGKMFELAPSREHDGAFAMGFFFVLLWLWGLLALSACVAVLIGFSTPRSPRSLLVRLALVALLAVLGSLLHLGGILAALAALACWWLALGANLLDSSLRAQRAGSGP